MTISVKARVRQVGAIGIFYSQTFQVTGLEVPMSRSDVVNAFLAQYGDKWELYAVESYYKTPEPAVSEGIPA